MRTSRASVRSFDAHRSGGNAPSSPSPGFPPLRAGTWRGYRGNMAPAGNAGAGYAGHTPVEHPHTPRTRSVGHTGPSCRCCRTWKSRGTRPRRNHSAGPCPCLPPSNGTPGRTPQYERRHPRSDLPRRYGIPWGSCDHRYDTPPPSCDPSPLRSLHGDASLWPGSRCSAPASRRRGSVIPIRTHSLVGWSSNDRCRLPAQVPCSRQMTGGVGEERFGRGAPPAYPSPHAAPPVV